MKMEPVSSPNSAHGVGGRHSTARSSGVSVSRGASCSEAVTAAVERCLRAEGANVRRNNPYSGGYVTQHYGRPTEGIHVLQVEINRSTYMDEQTLERLPQFPETERHMQKLIALLAREAPVLIRRR